MPRKNSAAGVTYTWRCIKQKGRNRKGNGIGSYSRKGKAKKAERYDRPYLDGSYSRWIDAV